MDPPATYAPVSIAIALCLLIGDTRGVQWNAIANPKRQRRSAKSHALTD